MQRIPRWYTVAALCAIVGWTGTAAAQLPVCPQPEPDAPYYTACLASGRFLVASTLTNLAIDQLLKPEGAPFYRRPREVLESLSTKDLLEKNAALVDFLGKLEPVKFSAIDTSTGMLQLDTAEDLRTLETTVDVGGVPYDISVKLPARIEGGYWRTPGVLQMAFWEGRRATFGVKSAGIIDMEAQIDCLVVSTDGIRAVTADPSTPDILIRFDGCP